MKTSIFLTCLLCAFLASCAQKPVADVDTTINGFIGADTFQVVVSAQPDTSAQGLAAMRESSLIRAYQSAHKRLQEELLSAGSPLLKDAPKNASTESEYAKELDLLSERFYKKSKIFSEFYDSACNCTVVVRISERGIKDRFFSELQEIISKGGKK